MTIVSVLRHTVSRAWASLRWPFVVLGVCVAVSLVIQSRRQTETLSVLTWCTVALVASAVLAAGRVDVFDQTKRLLLALAPIVMAMLAKRHTNTKENELAPALQQEAQAAHEQASRTSPHVGGLLGKILQQVQTPPA